MARDSIAAQMRRLGVRVIQVESGSDGFCREIFW
jgi:hypothetical protein